MVEFGKLGYGAKKTRAVPGYLTVARMRRTVTIPSERSRPSRTQSVPSRSPLRPERSEKLSLGIGAPFMIRAQRRYIQIYWPVPGLPDLRHSAGVSGFEPLSSASGGHNKNLRHHREYVAACHKQDRNLLKSVTNSNNYS